MQRIVLLLAYFVLYPFFTAFPMQENSLEDHVPQNISTLPIFVEGMFMENSSMYQMMAYKPLALGSKISFFNLINYEVGYDNNNTKSFINQMALYYNFVKGFSLGAGANLKSAGGFQPAVFGLYTLSTRDIIFVVQPSYELYKDGAFEALSVFEWHPMGEKPIQPYFKLQALLGYVDGDHSFSYHYWKAGVQYKNFRFGPAFNVQYIGTNSASNTNFGGFISALII